MTEPTRLAEKEDVIIERKIITDEEWSNLQDTLKSNLKSVNDSLNELYLFCTAEEADGVNLRLTKIKRIKDITIALNGSAESCMYALQHYILSESQKLQIDEHMRKFEDKLVWWADVIK